MTRRLAAILTCVLLLAGCGGNETGGDALEIKENGTYDVSGYSQVIVDVDESENAQGEENSAQDTDADGSTSDQELTLVRAQLKDFSLEVPAEFVEGYTEAELTENSSHTFYAHDVPEGATTYHSTTMSILSMNVGDVADALESFNDGPQEDVNGITMAVKHEHAVNSRMVEVGFTYNDVLYIINFSYMTDFDPKYGEYAEQFYRTIQMN